MMRLRMRMRKGTAAATSEPPHFDEPAVGQAVTQ